jgi:hypothetical protein
MTCAIHDECGFPGSTAITVNDIAIPRDVRAGSVDLDLISNGYQQKHT